MKPAHVAMRPAIDKAVEHLLSRRRPDGGWNEEMVWCPALTACYVIAHRAVGRPLDAADKAAVLRHLDCWQISDGSWGLHPASPGYLYVTVLCHVAARLCGRDRSHPSCRRALEWIHQRGGPTRTPTWGKAWLAIAGLYDWDGLQPLPPELFRLPAWLPIHPSRYYCHTRMIYLALSVAYALRFRMPEDDIVRALREELYPEGFASVRFADHRGSVAESDLYVAPSVPLRAAYAALGVAQVAVPAATRRATIERLLDEIRYEQRETSQQAISPVSGLLNVVALHAADPSDPTIDEALRGMRVWRWQDEVEGLRIAGALSHTWDTSFAVQALCAAPGREHRTGALEGAVRALLSYRVADDPDDHRKHWRSFTRGGWCFSNGRHRWPVSDCAAEALDALYAAAGATGGEVPAAVAAEAVEFILGRRDGSGGFSSYEERRGSALLGAINPSEMFDDCMIDRPYVECTASCVRALASALADRRIAAHADARAAVRQARRFLLGEQRPDGSWIGSWGVCFIYGTFHAVSGLRAAGMEPGHEAIRRAAAWILDRQRPDGAWGEDWQSCLERRYIAAPEGHAVQTAWALLTLDAAGVRPDHDAVRKAAAWLIDRQRPDGSWTLGQPAGVFMNTALLHYRLYPAVFPLWALALAYRAKNDTPR